MPILKNILGKLIDSLNKLWKKMEKFLFIVLLVGLDLLHVYVHI